MPLSHPSVPRQHLHTRRVEVRGYRREDGLWDVEGHLADTKTYSFLSKERGEVQAGEPVHEMWLRITVDDDLVIRAAEAVTEASPYKICPAITPNFARLVGIRIGTGFRREVKRRLGGTEGCTHLVELLGPIATTAYQTIYPYKARQEEEAGERRPRKRPGVLDTCHALASDGEVVRTHWPEFYTGG
ncbi:MAG: DUF2889 domain-containing protein [Rhodospirillales bacterium]|nr:DUF2889 domain-containing protein [Rhodospirillales bacterium]